MVQVTRLNHSLFAPKLSWDLQVFLTAFYASHTDRFLGNETNRQQSRLCFMMRVHS